MLFQQDVDDLTARLAVGIVRGVNPSSIAVRQVPNRLAELPGLDHRIVPTSDAFIDNPEAYTYDVIPVQGTITRLMGIIDSQGRPQQGYMPTLGQVILSFSPNTADTYTARVALTVADPVTRDGYPEFPDWIMDKYGNDILEGVLFRMMSQIAKPYSSPQMAQYHGKLFKQAVSQAKVEASHQNVYRGQSWRFPQTFARRRYHKF